MITIDPIAGVREIIKVRCRRIINYSEDLCFHAQIRIGTTF